MIHYVIISTWHLTTLVTCFDHMIWLHNHYHLCLSFNCKGHVLSHVTHCNFFVRWLIMFVSCDLCVKWEPGSSKRLGTADKAGDGMPQACLWINRRISGSLACHSTTCNVTLRWFPDVPPSSVPSLATRNCRLDDFIAYAVCTLFVEHLNVLLDIGLWVLTWLFVTIHIPTSCGVSSARSCLLSGRSTGWNRRCAPTWSGNSMSTPRCCMTFKLAFNMISSDCLQWYIFQQVVVYHRPRYVRFPRDQLDGTGDELLLGAIAQY
jgi:hypothetical protein